MRSYARFGLFFIAILFLGSLRAQEKNPTYSSFAIDNKEVIWVQVYHGQQPADSLSRHLFKFLKRKAWIKNLQYDGDELVADIQSFRTDYKRYGGKYMNTSNLIRTARWSGKTRVSFKDGKYRVVVYGIEYDARQPAMHAGKMNNQPHMIHGTWTDWVLNKYRTHFRKKRHTNMDIMHFNLKDNFSLTETELIDGDW
jgi:hypothetical protein